VKLLHGVLISVTLGAMGLGMACTLNPQPLPPETPDGSLSVDAGSFGENVDGAATVPTAGDRGDGGDDGTGGGGLSDSDAGDAAADGSDDGAVTDADDAGSPRGRTSSALLPARVKRPNGLSCLFCWTPRTRPARWP
jgi:hypothetical protein